MVDNPHRFLIMTEQKDFGLMPLGTTRTLEQARLLVVSIERVEGRIDAEDAILAFECDHSGIPDSYRLGRGRPNLVYRLIDDQWRSVTRSK